MSEPAEPVDAATVILARNGIPSGSPWQCFMVRRHLRMEFAADVFVFPGGKVDADDYSPDLAALARGHPEPWIENEEGREMWRALRLAAIRELFEEAGVLLARRANEQALALGQAEVEHFAQLRRRLQGGEINLLDLARGEQLLFPLDLLTQISRWITPEEFPRRFDTRFFVARMPHNQTALHESAESSESIWISPAEALRLHERGDFPLVFATVKHLDRLSRHHSVDDLIASVTPDDLVPVRPKRVRGGDVTQFVIPGDPGY